MPIHNKWYPCNLNLINNLKNNVPLFLKARNAQVTFAEKPQIKIMGFQIKNMTLRG